MIALKLYEGEQTDMMALIKLFWLCHNSIEQSEAETLTDLSSWSAENHKLYFITFDDEKVGFVHLGSRGAAIDWLEDLFIIPKYQNRGFGIQAIQFAEEIVKKYSDSLYIEAAARNEGAIRLYHKLLV